MSHTADSRQLRCIAPKTGDLTGTAQPARIGNEQCPSHQSNGFSANRRSGREPAFEEITEQSETAERSRRIVQHVAYPAGEGIPAYPRGDKGPNIAEVMHAEAY